MDTLTILPMNLCSDWEIAHSAGRSLVLCELGEPTMTDDLKRRAEQLEQLATEAPEDE